MNKRENNSQEVEVRKGPWTMEEDMILINYIATHGEGVWNSLALAAGLKRTGKSCRLRWLNYLKPDVRRGNITPEEQLLIMELHAKWGNRWSKIAKHLPGRTDNEIKNFWRTRIQKQLKQQEADHQQNINSSQSSSSNHHENASMNQMLTAVSNTTAEYYQVAQDIYSPPAYPEAFMDGFPDTAAPLLPPTQMPTNETQDVQVWSMEDIWSA